MSLFRTGSSPIRASALAATVLFAAGCLDDGRSRDTDIVDAWVAPRVDARAPIDASTDTTADASAPDAGDDIADCTPSSVQLLANPEFDDDDESLEPWEADGDVDLVQQPPYSADTQPNAVAILPGVGGEASARLAQRVEIPHSTTELTLSLKICIQNEDIRGEADEMIIVLESADGEVLDELATFASTDDTREFCQYEPVSAIIDPSGRYDGEVAYLVVSAETSDNDQATFFMDTFALRAACP
jgi:hypothetical protein